MKNTRNTLRTRLMALLMALVCVLGLLPASALAAVPDTIKLERFGMYGIAYDSANLGHCTLHEMFFDIGNNKTEVGFCGTKGGGMSNSLIGQTWSNKQPITDPTVKYMLAYYYSHINSQFTDEAHALGVDAPWDGPWAWYMNAWMQAIVWRYQAGTLTNPVLACAEEMVDVWNSLSGGQYSGIDDELMPGATFLDRAQYILDLGAQGVWGDCDVYLYDFTGAGSSTHPASSVQKIVMGELTIDETHEYYSLTIKKVDSTNPSKGLAGAKFHVESENGTFSKDVISSADGTCILRDLNAGTYAVTEVTAPDGYQIDNAGPQYVVLPNNGSSEVTVTFTDTPEITGSGTIRKVDADDPTKGLAGAVIKIDGVDNNFTGTYVTGAGGFLTDVPWDTMPIGSYTATEVTPPEGYSLSTDSSKVRQSFHWDGKSDVALVFENDARVKVQLLKTDESGNSLADAVFHIIKDGQIIGTEATDAAGSITVTNVTEGMYAFVEVSVPAPYACLTEPVFAHVDQATINGGGTVTVTAVDQKLPNLTILKRDAQTNEPISGTVFEVKGIHYGYHNDVSTGADGRAVLTALPMDSYEVTEKSVPDPYVIGSEPTQTIYLGPGENRELIFDNLKQPLLTISKVDADTNAVIPGTVFTIQGIDSDYRNDVTTGADGTVSLRVAPGSYRITEKSVPSPYYLPSNNADRVQTINLDAGDEKTVAFKDHKAPELTIYKEDSVAGAPIEGAKFHVTYTSNGEAADAPRTIDFGYMFSDSRGEIRLYEQGQRLYPGEYTVTEVAPAPGFQMKEPTTQKVIIHGGESKSLTFQNEPLNGIVVEKYDSVTHAALPGCTFQLRYLGGTSGTGGTVIGTKVTGKNGTAIWTDLTAGTYIVQEVDPADGYSIINASETVYLADDGTQSVVTVTFDNAPDGVLLIRKVCSVNPSVTLANAEFKVMYADGTLIGTSNGLYRTDENGEIRIPGLKPGKSVIVTEVKAPAGFLIDTQSQTIQIQEGKTVSLTFKNQPKGELIIQKRDSITGQPLPGAEFRITTAAGCEVGLDGVIGTSTLTQNGLFTTDSNGEIRITNLAPGAYVLTETKAPAGYVMDAPSTNVVIGANGDTQTVIVTNTPKGNLIVEKNDSVTKQPLSGAQFRITTASGELVADNEGLTSSNGLYTTNAEGQIVLSKLLPGTYVVSEVRSPDNYQADPTPQTVVINAGDTQTLRFYNDPLCVLTILKRDAVTRQPLKGAEFTVRDSEGRDIGHFVTGTDGTATVTGLTPNGTYIVSESKAPTGYIKDETPQNIVVRSGVANNLTFDNESATTLIIHKYIEGTANEPLAGVAFKVVDGSGAAVGPDDGVYYTDRAGEIVLEGLEPGTTVIAREIKTVEGYVLDGTPQDILIKAGMVQQLTFWNAKAGTLVIQKKDSVTGALISGAQFQLTYANGGFVDNANGHLSSNGLYTTDSTGEIRISGVTGTIVVKEIQAAPGYVIDQSTQVQTVTVNPEDTQTLTFLNDPLCSLTLTKLDSVTGKPVPGTEFTVKDGNGTVLGRYTTGKDGTVTVTGLVPGSTVVVTETKVPSGYVLDSTPQTITVKNGSNTLNSGSAGTTGGSTNAGGGTNGGNDLIFENDPKTQLVIEKYITGTTTPLKGATFLVTESNGRLLGNANGEFTTDENGRIVIDGLEPGVTIVAKEIQAPADYVLDTTPKSIQIKVGDAQILKFYNTPVASVQLIKTDADTGVRLANCTFEIRRIDDGLIGTYTTDKNGIFTVSLDAGNYYAIEIKAAEGYQLDDTPHYFEVKDGVQTVVRVTNKAFSGIIIHKVDSVTGKGIYGVKFLVYDQNKNPIGEYTTDNQGYIYIDDLTVLGKGKLFIRELEAAPGYELDPEYKTVYVQPGKTIEVNWTNTPITGQIQVLKYSADYNEVTGTPAGTPLQGAVYEISEARSGEVVAYITTDARGVAASKPLPLGRYKIREVTAPAYYQLDSTVFDETLEYSGQIIKLSAYDKSSNLGVTITKRGNAQVLAGNQMRYDITVSNTSNVALENFFWHDCIPTDAARATVLTTGTYSARLNYRILYKTNYNQTYQVLASNLLTTSNYSFSLNAIPLQAGEVVTDVYFEFGKVPVGFQSKTSPTLTVQVLGTVANGYQLVNRADVGGKYQGTWQTAQASWVTVVRKLTSNPTLPKTGY